jgi:hypothetical protein
MTAEMSKVKSAPKTSKYSKLGPYKDNVNRAMDHEAPGGQKYDPDKCSLYCKPYKYFGIQDPNKAGLSQCFCSNDLQKSTKYGKTSCGEKGGPWCNYIYNNENSGDNSSETDMSSANKQKVDQM